MRRKEAAETSQSVKFEEHVGPSRARPSGAWNPGPGPDSGKGSTGRGLRGTLGMLQAGKLRPEGIWGHTQGDPGLSLRLSLLLSPWPVIPSL